MPEASPVPSPVAWDHEEPLKVKAPVPPTPAQKLGEVQDTEVRMPSVESTWTGLDQADPSKVYALPELSTATQNDGETHDTASNWPTVSIPVKGVHELPSYVSASPALSTAAQKPAVGQEIETRLLGWSTGAGADHELPS